MDIRNEMEGLVQAEVAHVRETGGAPADTCWCTLCESDIIALALTLLPPFYCRTEGHGYASGRITGTKVHDAVQAALARVNRRPKHRPGSPETFRSDVQLVNYTLQVGEELVGKTMGRSAGVCDCALCRTDALAYALNRYPPKYGVLHRGRTNLQSTYIDFMRHELGQLITQAVRVVATHPHH